MTPAKNVITSPDNVNNTIVHNRDKIQITEFVSLYLLKDLIVNPYNINVNKSQLTYTMHTKPGQINASSNTSF